jgi:hypothetical protein
VVSDSGISRPPGLGDECVDFAEGGRCPMRNSDDAASRLCPLCQYVLVNQIDPFRHGLFDRDYAKEYRL